MGDRKYFGTDGIRGRANTYPMTAEVALRVGLAAGKLFRTGDDRRHLVVIGKDTRLSGYTIEPALVAGFANASPTDPRVGAEYTVLDDLNNGARKPGQSELAAWRHIVAHLQSATSQPHAVVA
mgnify:CR=1 FL=1